MREEAAMHHRFVIGLALCCWSALAQQPPAPSLTVHPLKEGAVYWIEGGGGNSTVVIGQNGVIVVDAKTTPDGGRQLVGEIAKLTPKPITHVHRDPIARCAHPSGEERFLGGVDKNREGHCRPERRPVRSWAWQFANESRHPSTPHCGPGEAEQDRRDGEGWQVAG